MTKTHIRTSGLTLIELIVTISIAGILIAVSVPSFTVAIQNTRMATQINTLQTSLSLARSEAVKRNNNITICQSSNGSSCTGNWQNGWIVFVDSNFDGAVDGEEILRVQGVIAGSNTLTFNQTRVIYANNGIAISGLNGVFTLCDLRGAASAKSLVIGPSGRPRLGVDGDPDLVCPS